MRLIAMAMIVAPFTCAVAAGKGGDLELCAKRHTELTALSAGFTGEAQIKRLIEADLRRARKEQMEGDGDECLEALDHATKLLRGEY